MSSIRSPYLKDIAEDIQHNFEQLVLEPQQDSFSIRSPALATTYNATLHFLNGPSVYSKWRSLLFKDYEVRAIIEDGTFEQVRKTNRGTTFYIAVTGSKFYIKDRLKDLVERLDRAAIDNNRVPNIENFGFPTKRGFPPDIARDLEKVAEYHKNGITLLMSPSNWEQAQLFYGEKHWEDMLDKTKARPLLCNFAETERYRRYDHNYKIVPKESYTLSVLRYYDYTVKEVKNSKNLNVILCASASLHLSNALRHVDIDRLIPGHAIEKSYNRWIDS